jgi:ParB family chromosome partitioning protein
MSVGKRARLGKGLGALLGEGYLANPGGGGELRTLPLERILPNPLQPRQEFREEELQDLSKSIQENGLLQPLIVRPEPDSSSDRYQLVAGERRLRAITSLGWSEVPVVIRAVDDRTLLVLALVENIQREGLNPLEEAEGYHHLSQEFGLTQGEIAEAVGKNRSTVANALRLLKLPLPIQTLLGNGSLSMGHARALLSLEDPEKILDLGRRAVRDSWSVREVEARVRALLETSGKTTDKGEQKRRPTSPQSLAARALEEALRESLGARVAVREGKEGAGTIEIPYHSPEDFERIFESITGQSAQDVAG